MKIKRPEYDEEYTSSTCAVCCDLWKYIKQLERKVKRLEITGG